MSGVRLPSPGPASTSFPSSPIPLIASAPDSERFCEIASLGFVGRAHSLQDLIFECRAFGIVLLEPFVCGDRIGKDLNMIGVARIVSGIDVNPNGRHGSRMVELAKKLRRRKPKGGRRSLRAVALDLEKAGFVSHAGKRYAATAVARMLGEL